MSAAKRKHSEIDCSFDIDDFAAEHGLTGDQVVLGIDEAGRGPVIGPMVYSGGFIPIAQHSQLRDCGVADSKQLDENKRQRSLEALKLVKSFQYITKVLSATQISEVMTCRSGRNLNTVSHDTAISIIREAVLACKGKLAAVFVDVVGIVDHYQALLKRRFPHLIIVVSSKADAKFPVVSAASIVAKTTRDSLVESLGVSVGSGYPGDQLAVKFIHSNVHKFFVYPTRLDMTRMSWGPVQEVAKANVFPATFENDVKEEERTQLSLSFKKPPPRRETLLSHALGLQSFDSYSS